MKKSIKKTWMVVIAAILVLITVIIIMAEFVKKKSVQTGSDAVRGMRNNNPLNLRRTGIKWKHERVEVTDKEFEEFDSLMWGLRAGLRNMRTKIKQGFETVGSLIAVWAPPSENNTNNYIEIVGLESGYGASTKVEFENEFMYPIVKSMCKIESGLDLSKELYNEAWKNI